MRGRDRRLEASAELGALPRLSMKPHTGNPPLRALREYRIRLYDGDQVVGYIPVPNSLVIIAISAAL
jgi:hypothetical protein